MAGEATITFNLLMVAIGRKATITFKLRYVTSATAQAPRDRWSNHLQATLGATTTYKLLLE